MKSNTFSQIMQLRRDRDIARQKLKEKFIIDKHATVAWFNAEDERIDREYERKLKALKVG